MVFEGYNKNGFTLLELVTVVVVIGVLSTIVAPRFLSLGSYNKAAAKKQLLTSLRYAQQQAMSREGGAKFCYSNSSYGIYRHDDDCPDTPHDPDPTEPKPLDSRSGTRKLDDAVAIQGTGSLNFNGIGALSSKMNCSNRTVRLMKDGQEFARVQVDCYTGFPYEPDS